MICFQNKWSSTHNHTGFFCTQIVQSQIENSKLLIFEDINNDLNNKADIKGHFDRK